ncbi:MAG: type II toxin-antitoxin system RelE/ParE family toxin [Paludibacteraceae bacterium]|nr:type II toxin-antitoxin system RelE/ParE family toxin [Paludibacteraceae bacterium]
MKIIWTESAQKSQDAAAAYIFNEFGAMPLIDFYKNLDEIEEDLSDFPELGRIEPLLQDRSKSYRSLVATKYNKIIYYVDDDKIYIVDFWDTRREPKAQVSRLK